MSTARYSPEDGQALFQAQMAKCLKACHIDNDEPDEGLESELQRKIAKWAKDHGHPLLYFPRTPKVRAFLPAGWPDDILVLPGRVVFFELKQSSGRLSEDQKMMRLIFLHHGHTIHEIRSYRKFLSVVEG